MQDDSVVNAKILNISFSARRPDATGESQFYSPVFLQERVYLNRAILARLATVQVKTLFFQYCFFTLFNFKTEISIFEAAILSMSKNRTVFTVWDC